MRQGGNGVTGQHGGMSWMKRRRKRREERGAEHHDLTVIHTQNLQAQPKYVHVLYTSDMHSVAYVALLPCLHHIQYWIASSISIPEGNVCTATSILYPLH